MAGTAIRRSVAEPEHLLFGVPCISYMAFIVFPLGAMATAFGFGPGLAVGVGLSALIHFLSIVIRMKQPHTQRLIIYWFSTRGVRDAFRKRRRLYLR